MFAEASVTVGTLFALSGQCYRRCPFSSKPAQVLDFARLLRIVVPRFVPIGRKTVTSKINEEAARLSEKIISILNKFDTISVTINIDLWSDRKTSLSFGIAAPYVIAEVDSVN